MKKLIFLMLLGFSQIVFSEPSKSDKDLYDLQDKCKKTTEEEFRKEWGKGIVNDKDTQMISTYSNHYNKKLNKCFYLLTTTSYPKKKTKNKPLEMKSIWDIQENKSYGELDSYPDRLMICNVGDIQCSSKQEWESLIKPYMND